MFYFTLCNQDQQKQVNKFYKSFKTNVSCHRKDQTYAAFNEGQEVVAALLIRHIDNFEEPLLRSLYVHPELRSRGLARSLCETALSQHQGPCLTLCETGLVSFYQSLGFQPRSQQTKLAGLEKQIKKGLRLLRRP